MSTAINRALMLAAMLALSPATTFAGDEAALEKIDTEGLLERISTLASDEFGGRAPMSDGERLTLNYLEKEFRDMGLKPMFGDSYRQAVPLVSIEADPDMALSISGVTIPESNSGTIDTPRPASTIRTMTSVEVVSISTRGDKSFW